MKFTKTQITYVQHNKPNQTTHAWGVALNKAPSYDLICQVKEVVASFGNNRKEAYNNLVPSQAILNCQRLRLPQSVAIILSTILNNIVYRLKIGHVLSARTYQTNTFRRILGKGPRKLRLPVYIGGSTRPNPMGRHNKVRVFYTNNTNQNDHRQDRQHICGQQIIHVPLTGPKLNKHYNSPQLQQVHRTSCQGL